MGFSNATITSVASVIATQVCSIKYLVYGLLPTVAFILFLLSGLVYAAGQVFGAETKAKAQGWAVSLLVGGIIGIIITILAPAVVTIFTTGTQMEDFMFCATS